MADVFDVDAARKAGATDDQILDYLGKQKGYDVQGAISAGASKPDVIAYLSGAGSGPRAAQQDKNDEARYSDDALFEMAKNTPASAGRFASGLMEAVTNPKQTLKAMGGLALGTVQKLIPGKQDAEPYADAAIDFYKNRYGGAERALNTVVEDPVGFAADASALFTGIGGAARSGALAAKASRLPMLAGKANAAADASLNAARTVDPIMAGVRGAKAVIGGSTRAFGGPTTPEALYESALKPPKGKAWPVEKQQKVVDTGLREGVVLRRGGMESLEQVRDKIDAINDEIAAKIQSGAQQGATVDPRSVAQRVDQVPSAFDSVNPEADLAAIDASKAEYLRKHSVDVPMQVQAGKDPFTGLPMTKTVMKKKMQPVPVDEAQLEKQKTYTQLRGKYGELKSATVESQKALARGIKEELAAQFPELNALNARESALIDLENAVERFISRTGSRDVLPFKGAMVSPRGVLDATIATVVDNPEIKSKLAIAIYKARNPKSKVGLALAVGSRLPMVGTQAERASTSTSTVPQ